MLKQQSRLGTTPGNQVLKAEAPPPPRPNSLPLENCYLINVTASQFFLLFLSISHITKIWKTKYLPGIGMLKTPWEYCVKCWVRWNGLKGETEHVILLIISAATRFSLSLGTCGFVIIFMTTNTKTGEQDLSFKEIQSSKISPHYPIHCSRRFSYNSVIPFLETLQMCWS